MNTKQLSGRRTELRRGRKGYPSAFEQLHDPPEVVYVLGDPDALRLGLGVIGARKATPYGIGCAHKFATMAALRGIPIISGGARGCDSEGHRAALGCEAPTVAILGGGIDEYYPREHGSLFQAIVDGGGAVVSEHPWDEHPLPAYFRQRNRLIAALSKALLIVEAGLPSGTYSTADAALEMGKEVLVVPGSITSPSSHGSNRLLYQGAFPIVDEDSFSDVLFSIFGLLKQEEAIKTAELSKSASVQTGELSHDGIQERERKEPSVVQACELQQSSSCDQSLKEFVPAPTGKARVVTTPQRIVRPALNRKSYRHSAHDVLLDALDAQPHTLEGLKDLAQGVIGESTAAITWLMVWLADAQRDGLVTRYADGKYGPCIR